MAKKANNAKALASQKRHRRRWLTFYRMCRYGLSNFTRNAWLTVAATAVMTITLLIVFVTVVAQSTLTDTTTQISKKNDRSIYLKSDTDTKNVKKVSDGLKKLSNVESVTVVSKEQGRKEFAEKYKADPETINALNQATGDLPIRLSIVLVDTNDTSQLINFVKTNQSVKEFIDPENPPTFMSSRKVATDTIASWTKIAEQSGVVMSVIFTGISILIIFNTIRMAIFNRRDEIEMMKLIGADKSFIRGPFVVEAMTYGVIAAVFATGIGIGLLLAGKDSLVGWGVAILPTIDNIIKFLPIVLLMMIALGAFVGMISALLATRRYLKI